MAFPLPALLLGALAAGSGVAGAAAPAVPAVGERLTYSVSLGMFGQAATARIEILDRSKDGLRLRAEVQSESMMEAVYPIHYVLITTATPTGMTPLRSSRRTEDRRGTAFLALRFDRQEDRVLLSSRAGADPFASAPILHDTRDLLSALYQVRAMASGDPLEMTLWEDGLYRVRVERTGEEMVQVPAGRFPTVRYLIHARPPEGEPQVRDVLLWLSDDERRLPVQLRATTLLGQLEASLTAHQGPAPEPDGE